MDNLNSDQMAVLVRRIEKLERGAPVGFSSVSRGALRITSAEGLIVEGSAKVSGILTGLGQLLWDGVVKFTAAFTSTGVTRFEGDTTQVGAHHVQGNQDITGTLAVKGAATLENNLIVKAAGKITIEGTTALEFSAVGGIAMVKFGDGPRLLSSGASAQLDAGSGTGMVVANATSANLRSPNSANTVSSSNSGTSVAGPFSASAGLTLTNLPTQSATGRTPNLWMDSTTKIVYRLI